MGLVTAAVVGAAAAAAGAAYSIYSGERAASAQKDAMKKQEKMQTEALEVQKTGQQQAMELQKKQAATAEQNINRASRKQPDVAAIMTNAEQMAGQGPAGTMLTGPQGVDPNALALGKNTLLGG